MLSRRNILGLVAASIVAMGLSTSASAATINGTLAVGGLGTVTLTPGGSDLSNNTDITIASLQAANTGTGDLSVITVGTILDAPVSIDLNNLASFTMDLAGNGTFAAVAVGSYIVSRSANFMDLYILGEITPAGALSMFDKGPASLRLSLTRSQVGGQESISISGTLGSPPINPVPEPASMAMVGTAVLAGLGLVARRRFRTA